MARQVTIAFCGMEGNGETVTKAKQDAQHRITAVLAGNWTPYYLSHHGILAIVARQPNGTERQWDYQTVQMSESHRPLYLSSNYATREDAVQSAAYHLAQLAATYEGLEFWISPAQQRDLDTYFQWQAAYAVARAEGLADHECRQRADAAQVANHRG